MSEVGGGGRGFTSAEAMTSKRWGDGDDENKTICRAVFGEIVNKIGRLTAGATSLDTLAPARDSMPNVTVGRPMNLLCFI